MGTSAPAPRSMRPLPALLSCVLAMGPGAWGQEKAAEGAREPLPLAFEGGSADDRDFARAAAGRARGAGELPGILAAIRATDRFRRVEGTPEGAGFRIRLEAWPPLLAWSVQDDGESRDGLTRKAFGEVRKGVRAGLARREEWREHAERLLRASGYPSASVAVEEEEGGARLSFRVRRGRPDRVARLRLEGSPGPYREADLFKLTGVVPGRSLWTLTARREALARLRKRFIKDHRYEWRAEFRLDPDGTLVLQADPGPVVELRAEGASLGFGGIEDLAPLARAERYGPELLDEGDRKIFRYLRNRGHLEPTVSHRRDVVAGTPERPERVRITYSIQAGPTVVISRLRFEGNEAIGERELAEAAALPAGLKGLGAPKASPDLLQGLEDRIRALYLRKGYSEVRVRRAVPELEGGRWVQAFIIREGPLRQLAEVLLELPDGAPYDPWGFGEDLLPLLGERPVRLREAEPRGGAQRVFAGDRPGTTGVRGRLERLPAEGGRARLRFVMDRPVPYVKGDLVQAVAALRSRLSSLGVQRPKEELDFEEAEGILRLRLRIPDAPRLEVQRLVVVGSDGTRARAVLREAELDPGRPVSPETLGRAQARIADLGAFQRVDLEPLPGAGDGALALRLTERSPWIFSHSFGYDRSQGYHLGSSVQRLNVAGMGRSIDAGILAGDATLDSASLRRAFPTGDFTRSVDKYFLGYTDPRLTLGGLDWIPDRTQYRVEGAYVVERQSVYEVRRRRLLNTLDWHLDSHNIFQVGHRYERAEVKSRFSPRPDIAEQYQKDLFDAAKIPDGRVIISAPFVQYTRDYRDSAFDPTRGTYFFAHIDFANQVFGTSGNSSFVKLDLRQQWNWPLGFNASRGVVTLGLRVGVADPTASSAENFPISERFFAGGPFTHRGVEPDGLGPRSSIAILDPATGYYKLSSSGNPLYDYIPIGGQGLALVNLEVRFPVYGTWLWSEVFLDSGQVYASLKRPSFRLAGSAPPFPPFRTSLGVGLIFKLGLPIKVEYAADVKRIFGKPRSQDERDTELHGVLVSAGFRF